MGIKRISSVFIVMMLASACSNNDISVPPYSNEFRGEIYKELDTKTHLSETLENSWDEGDMVSIFVGNTCNQRFKFDGATGDRDGTFTEAGALGFGSFKPLKANYSVYPYNSSTSISEEGVISVSLPSHQTYASGSYGIGDNTMVAVTKSVEDRFLYFKNVCGYLRVSLYGDATIKSISLQGNNGEIIAGTGQITVSNSQSPSVTMLPDGENAIEIDCCEGVRLGSSSDEAIDFYFVLPPTEFTCGITVRAKDTDGRIYEKSTGKVISITRNKVQKMAALEFKGQNNNDIPNGELSFFAVEPTRIRIMKNGTPYSIVLEHLLKDSKWEPYTIGEYITLEAGDSVCFRAGKNGNERFSNFAGTYYYFDIDGKVLANGNIMSLLNQSMNRVDVPNYAFNNLFNSCKGLISAPSLPAVKVGMESYKKMFYNCINLRNAPDLPATSISSNCYDSMFEGCSSLKAAPKLNAQNLANKCYLNMFSGCTELSAGPALPAKTLAEECYSGMFMNSGLISAPELPAEILTEKCYKGMFTNCKKLTEAPALNAKKLATSCYAQMFESCTSITAAPELPATELEDYCYQNMFAHCTNLIRTTSLPAKKLSKHCYNAMFSGSGITIAPMLPATELADYCYFAMFSSSKLTSVPDLPAKTLADHCYSFMFSGCNSIKEVSEIPALSLSTYCYEFMFSSCDSLTKAPSLPNMTLEEGCYWGMFSECKDLVTPPDLPATTLKPRCYAYMFSSCSRLKVAPILPARVLERECYREMFSYCGTLNYVKMLGVDISARDCLASWLNKVSTKGVFIKNSESTWNISGGSGIPIGWTVENESE